MALIPIGPVRLTPREILETVYLDDDTIIVKVQLAFGDPMRYKLRGEERRAFEVGLKKVTGEMPVRSV